MLQQKGTLTFNEMSQQPDAWKSALQIVNNSRQDIYSWFVKEAFAQVVFIGTGSSYNAALACANFFLDVTGVNSAAFPSSELFYGLRLPYDDKRKTLVIALSRSGETSETLWGIDRIRAKSPNSRIFAMTAAENSSILTKADKALVFPDAREESYVATKSYTSFVIAVKLLTSILIKNAGLYNEIMKVPSLLEIRKYHTEVQKVVSSKFTGFLTAGCGQYYAHAQEGSQLIKTMAAAPCDTNHTLELRHGNAAYATQQMLSIVLSTSSMQRAEGVVLGELAAIKCHRMVLCEKADSKLGLADFVIELNSGLSEHTRDLLMIPILQELAFYMAIAKGYNPDKPKHVAPVVIWKEPYF